VETPPDYRWFHVVLTTYGTWLYGDPRGFRTRRHMEHIEGDYKNPPPAGKYAEQEQRSRERLKHDPVHLSTNLKSLVGQSLVDRLQSLGAFVLAVAVATKHAHLLVKLPPSKATLWSGAAKRHAWFELREKVGWSGKLWARKGKATPVKDRQHQLNVYRYILKHERQEAWTWKWQKK